MTNRIVIQQQKSEKWSSPAPKYGVIEVFENGKIIAATPANDLPMLLFLVEEWAKKGILNPK